VIEAESQAMLNTFTELNFHDAYKMAKLLIRKGRGYFEGDGSQ
jgi:hypothetical protein